ncbi:tetratricopeptide repeat protein [Flavobacterium sp. xlx-214]|uniref:tetratricopeptide repeat protein n=1 Tax=unclassified Flavobacterium TaxID=196869 RepID=UPI0013D293F1|nr:MULTISPECIES: tetratricopeptide repeat protein [unclassified Flavobacterium]MBA5793996.1 tetratricopeptide repeat protein [Flavobacterium sp. xlx-221]QMI82635.1 tetratricopeptide repeat protein [Flavobacterium sp. xlx-214]
MRKSNHFLYLSFLLGSLSVQAQQSHIYTQENKDFYDAVNLYNEQQYAVAQILFDKVKIKNTHDEIQAESAYYSANCAIRLGQAGAEQKINQFIYDYPTSAKQSQAYVDVSNFYFLQGDYEQSLVYAEKINEEILSPANKDRYNFQKGYAYFSKKDIAKANTFLQKVDLEGTYGNQAKYYLGYLSYENNDYEQANEYFSEVESVDKYQERMGYYKADMQFKGGNFEKAIEEGLAQMPKSSEAEKSELSKIIGESYFNLKQYDKALPYLLAYQGKEGKWSNTDFYQLGYSYYQQKQYDKAVSEFNKIIGGKDAVAQNAYYHLGESYLNLNQKTQALNAFKNASEMNFSAKIQEDAFANYAKLSYEIGNPYKSTPAVITDFLEKYPETPYKQELNDLLIDSYISTKNYQAALDVLESNKTTLNKPAYQKVTFYRGLEYFNDGKYSLANGMFNKSIAERQDNKFVARATYWRGESEYALNKFNDAYQTFTTFKQLPQAQNTPEFKNVEYNLGYAAYKLKNYSNANTHFKSFLTVVKDDAKKTDATLRLADGYFVTKQYWPAMEMYNSILKSNSAYKDYAAYQKAIAYGFVDKNTTKVDELQKFISAYPSSNLVDDAYYELGSTYANEKQSGKALESFNKLINNYPQSNLISKAILRQGLVYVNDNQEEKGIERFKKVVTDYPGSQDAIEAVQNARAAYIEIGKSAEFVAWVKNLDFVDISTAELENDVYTSAENQMAQNNNDSAIKGLKEYVSNYPNGLHATKSYFNLAEIYFSKDNTAEAKANYENVLKRGKSEYTEQSLMRLSNMYLAEKDQTNAKRVLAQLEGEASNDANKLFAQANLMKIAYDANDITTAAKYANALNGNAKVDKRIKADATAISARVAIKNGDTANARKLYEQLNTLATGELKAEALYYDAYFKHVDKKYDASNKIVEKVVKDYSAYKYYNAKSLVLLAKNFYQLKDSYQATYVLENVISNATDFSDVVTEAKAELAKIKSEEAKRNSSVK